MMKIEIESEVLIANQISANQFCYLYLKFMFGNIPVIFTLCEDEYYDLEKKGFIKIGEGEKILREKSYSLFEVSDEDKCWFEFKSRYPVKAEERRLHDNQDKCKKRYISLIQNKPDLHKSILKGLENEQSARVNAARKSQFFPNWKLMSSYINSKHWEGYLDYKQESNNIEEKTEGVN